jgi:hypothetical protein
VRREHWGDSAGLALGERVRGMLEHQRRVHCRPSLRPRLRRSHLFEPAEHGGRRPPPDRQRDSPEGSVSGAVGVALTVAERAGRSSVLVTRLVTRAVDRGRFRTFGVALCPSYPLETLRIRCVISR